ncbi:hypothetical protein QAD02_023669 [Eretmocerus hayati]|uniref:Uncharacterized protein n=1 Tax=Eretmocerus hayati TaxID=131215 RepID=A0ACC2PYY9_9HYME|nr:hypothetical protein QAD02_023669 [Eretmocerus hayati]
MATVFKCSIFSILKLQKFHGNIPNQEFLRNAWYYSRRQDFILLPNLGIRKSHKVTPAFNSAITNYILICAIVTIAIILIGTIVETRIPYPLRASCLVKWNFGEPCLFVIQKLRSQIIQWSNEKSCGSKCSYKFYDFPPFPNDTIRAVHISIERDAIDDINIVLAHAPRNHCSALAESTAENWYTMFDNGRNYCNLYDLIMGAGYYFTVDFSEDTNDKICTQYEMAKCD